MNNKDLFALILTPEERSELSHLIAVTRGMMKKEFEENRLFLTDDDPQVKKFKKGLTILGHIQDKITDRIEI